jgi:Domain of unknown function (DUF4277)
MESVRVERLDHCGVMASVIKDLGLIAMRNARLGPDAQEGRTPGEAVAGMIRNGLGFAHRPRSLTPPCVANTPRELWWRDGLRAAMLNRFTRGRMLDEAYAYGCDLLCHELALAVCGQEGLDLRFTHLDPTSVARRGDDVPDRDAHAIRLPPGDAKDHRPDLKQAVWELMVSQDGGVPCGSQSGDGTTAEPQSFQARAQAVMRALTPSARRRDLLADAKRYTEDNAANRQGFGFITRLAHTSSVVAHGMEPALTWDMGPACEEPPRYPGVELCHDGRAQRWLVVESPAALERAEAPSHQATPRHSATSAPPRLPLQAQRFSTPAAAQDALATVTRGGPSHQRESSTLIAPQRDAGKGRATPRTPRQDTPWQIRAHVRPAEEAMWHRKQRQAGVVLGTPIGTREWSDTAVMAAYNTQSRVEGGCRWLKDPRLLASALVVKTPGRLQGLLLVRT